MKLLMEMSVPELRAELHAAIEAERAADFVDGLTAWTEARLAASRRQDAVVCELARRQHAQEGHGLT